MVCKLWWFVNYGDNINSSGQSSECPRGPHPMNENMLNEKHELCVKCAELMKCGMELKSREVLKAFAMCVDELIERYKDKGSNSTTSEESCTQRYEGESSEDGYDSDMTTMGDNLPLQSPRQESQGPLPALSSLSPPSPSSPSSPSESHMSQSCLQPPKRPRLQTSESPESQESQMSPSLWPAKRPRLQS